MDLVNLTAGALRKHVSELARCVSKRAVQGNGAIRVEIKDGRFTLAACDFDQSIEIALGDALAAPDFLQYVLPSTLKKALQGLPAGDDVRLGLEGDSLTLDAGGVLLTLPHDADRDAEWADLGPVTVTEALTLPDDFSESLGFVENCIGTDKARHYLNGACLYYRQSEAGVVATDGYRLRHVTLQMKRPESFGDFSVILPPACVAFLRRNFGKADSVSLAGGRLNPLRVVIEAAGHTYTSRLIDGSFPDFERVIPKDRVGAFGFEATGAALKTKLGRLTKFATDEDSRIALTVNSKVQASISDSASASFDTVETWGDDCISVNGHYLLDALPDNPQELVRLIAYDALAPVRIEYPEHPARVGVLMPMRP
jgi:DNA polymerase-3 subunit beta